MEEVKLFSFWGSPFSQRVIWALKLKGVSYEYIEEDISNKSNQLLEYNPVHKKVPVLVHGGKPVAESMVILEYIDETWPENPLLPKDEYERSTVRFWAKFIDEKVRPMWEFFILVGEKQEKAIKDNFEILRTIEEHGLGEQQHFFGGNKIGLADIALGWIVHVLEPMEEIVGVKFIEADTYPRLHAWVKNFKEVPAIKENLPNRDGVLEFLKGKREMFIKTACHDHHH
ncbi:hypothetical protein F0562_000599 [Nyssa sinensis]|uniref:Glutathione S-transferase n=1 Tax=Nyssa sinensis TaxID=561372 RepID=A0A5J5C0K1_9ASTE|nr:hypothetical protein F0562_000599 [Nyssa sinensis]